MPTNDYHFVDKWRVEGDLKEVADIIEDALSLPRWWPSVYFEVKEIEPGGEHGVGKLISLRAAGWLPYTLRISFRTFESHYPNGFSMEATGDLESIGIWNFEQDAYVSITYDWTIRANKPVVQKLSFLLKPIFRSNHNWTMKRGEESLKLELLRRRARAPEEAARVPAPLGPAFPHDPLAPETFLEIAIRLRSSLVCDGWSDGVFSSLVWAEPALILPASSALLVRE